MSFNIKNPFKKFTEADGTPLETGYIWIGEPDLDAEANPVAVFWDEALTIAATQPIRTIGGYPDRTGSPADIFVADNYSITVEDKNNVLVFSKPSLSDDDLLPNGQPHLYATKLEAETENPLAPGLPYIFVFETTDVIIYVRTVGGSDLIGADGSTWMKRSVNQGDLVGLAADFNALRDFYTVEKGVWNPVLQFSGGGGTFTYATQDGDFIRTDDSVRIRGDIDVTIDTLGVGTLQVAGLPFAVRAGIFAELLPIVEGTLALTIAAAPDNIYVRVTPGSLGGPIGYTVNAVQSFLSVSELTAGETVTLAIRGTYFK